MDLNKLWMSNAKNIGCTFAALFAKNPDVVGWKTMVNPDVLRIPKDAFIISLQFPDMNKAHVLNWALNNGFYLEEIGEGNKGLRYKTGGNISWVQYFGKDSHVKTRQAPIPELMMCVKLPTKYYWQVGFKGILHLAHAGIQSIKYMTKVEKMWETSFKQTKKSLGHSPTLKEAAKTTYYEKATQVV